jgi:hypothetical protein
VAVGPCGFKSRPRHRSTTGPVKDHHSEYLAKTILALSPEGHARVDELLDGLAASVGDTGLVAQFAVIHKQEADSGKLAAGPDPGRSFTRRQLDDLITGFTIIRDQEPLDDVNDWANAVIQLLEDDAESD